MDTARSFFDQLDHGLADIDAKVNRLKALSGNNFIHENNEEPCDIGLEKIRNFENDIRSMHQDVMGLKNLVLHPNHDLDSIEQKLLALSSHLNQFVVKNDLTKYGYKPWISTRPAVVDESDASDSDADKEKANGVVDSEQQHISIPAKPVEDTTDVNGTGIPVPALEQLPASCPTPIPKKRSTPTPKSVAFREDEDRKRKNARSRHKLEANLFPTPRNAFLPVAAKRFTILPPGLTQFIATSEKPDGRVFSRKEVVHDTSRSNPFASEATTRINLPIMMQSYHMPQDATPSHTAQDSTVNEHETIEFTPGLTTRRPVAVRRCKPLAAVVPDKGMNDVVNSFKNMSFVGTPTQPVPSRDLIASVKAVKSHGKMKQVGDKLVPATPQMPVSKIDENVFKYLLRNRNKQK